MATNLGTLGDNDGIGVDPISDVIGAEIHGVDLSQDLAPATFGAIHRAWLEYSVIVFRDQRLNDDDLIRFSRRLGELDCGPNMAWQPDEGRRHPEIFVISNVVEDGNPIGFLGDTELDWHSDVCHSEMPPKATALYSFEIPTDGSGDTGYMSMYALLDALPADLRERIDGLQMRHEAAHTLQGELRLGRDGAPDPVHPLVRTHPDTGRKALFLGRQRNGVHRAGTIVGIPPDESDALLDRIWEQVREETLAWYHSWRVGDFILWDNRCVMHRRGPFNSKMRRIMHRTQIKDSVAPA